MLSLWMVVEATTAFGVTPDPLPEHGDLERATAQALIADVETKALPPRVPAEYDAAKARLVAIVLTPQTASASEMVAIALRGEPKARTFGQKTYGATTGNVVTALPDGATVLLTTSRYAIGDGPPLRGPLLPDVPARPGDSPDTTLRQAVSSAAQGCPAPSP